MVKRINTNVETIAYKFRAYPDTEQHVLLSKTFGCVRYLWNRLINDRDEHYRLMGYAVHNTPADYKCLDECSWLNEVDSSALAFVQIKNDQAYSMFFQGKTGHPRFHKKRGKQSFTSSVTNNNIRLTDNGLKLPKIKDPVKIHQHRKIKPGGKLKSVTVSRDVDGKYYVSLLYEYPLKTFTKDPVYKQDPSVIGLDMKLGSLYVDSDGKSADMSDFYRLKETKLAKEQAKLSHMTRGSKNYQRQLRKISKLHTKIKYQRLDFLRKKAYRLAKQYDVICVEDLDLKEMSSTDNYVLSPTGKHQTHGRSVHSNGYGIFLSWLTWDCKKFGHELIKVDRYYPSTQTCSCCGYVQKLDITDRIYICPKCHTVIDRDINSAINIKTEGLRLYHKQNKTA